MVKILRLVQILLLAGIHQHVKGGGVTGTVNAIEATVWNVEHFRFGDAFQEVHPAPLLKVLFCVCAAFYPAGCEATECFRNKLVELDKKKDTDKAISSGRPAMSLTRSPLSSAKDLW